MNDRYKFRAWDKTENAYIEDAQFTYDDGCEGGMGSFRHYSFRDLLEDKNCIVEQCTGLKDKNGKLVYENDLIKCPSGIYRIAVDDFGLWTAIYKNNPFEGVGEWSDMVKEYAFNQNNVEIEIIGNIHENADLLENEE